MPRSRLGSGDRQTPDLERERERDDQRVLHGIAYARVHRAVGRRNDDFAVVREPFRKPDSCLVAACREIDGPTIIR